MPRPRAFDEAVALDRAMELFWERGYEATSVSDLESHLGVGRQSLYNAFGDKHDLFLKALERYTGVRADGPQRHLLAADAGVDAIRAFFDDQVTALTPPGPRRACFVANTIVELGAQDEEALARCDHARRLMLKGFRHALGNAVKQGELPAGYDVEAGAMLLLSQVYGLAVIAKTGASAQDMRDSVSVLLSFQ